MKLTASSPWRFFKHAVRGLAHGIKKAAKVDARTLIPQVLKLLPGLGAFIPAAATLSPAEESEVDPIEDALHQMLGSVLSGVVEGLNDKISNWNPASVSGAEGPSEGL